MFYLILTIFTLLVSIIFSIAKLTLLSNSKSDNSKKPTKPTPLVKNFCYPHMISEKEGCNSIMPSSDPNLNNMKGRICSLSYQNNNGTYKNCVAKDNEDNIWLSDFSSINSKFSKCEPSSYECDNNKELCIGSNVESCSSISKNEDIQSGIQCAFSYQSKDSKHNRCVAKDSDGNNWLHNLYNGDNSYAEYSTCEPSKYDCIENLPNFSNKQVCTHLLSNKKSCNSITSVSGSDSKSEIVNSLNGLKCALSYQNVGDDVSTRCVAKDQNNSNWEPILNEKSKFSHCIPSGNECNNILTSNEEWCTPLQISLNEECNSIIYSGSELNAESVLKGTQCALSYQNVGGVNKRCVAKDQYNSNWEPSWDTSGNEVPYFSYCEPSKRICQDFLLR
tara:strand:+ start:767 stop:1936 length:1170 start_codon:yes stop_codon:yes gene_type:complete